MKDEKAKAKVLKYLEDNGYEQDVLNYYYKNIVPGLKVMVFPGESVVQLEVKAGNETDKELVSYSALGWFGARIGDQLRYHIRDLLIEMITTNV